MALELSAFDTLPAQVPAFARGFMAALIATSGDSHQPPLGESTSTVCALDSTIVPRQQLTQRSVSVCSSPAERLRPTAVT